MEENLIQEPKKRGRRPMEKPNTSNPEVKKELDSIERQLEASTASMKSVDKESLPVQETEMQAKLSQNEIAKMEGIVLKPKKTQGSNQVFNERFRKEYEYRKEYVNFIAEHKELIGENIEKWTRPYGGLPAEFWEVPTNKPVWGPRYLAEEIKKSSYVRYVQQDRVQNIGGAEGVGQMYTGMVAETIVQRLDAHPVSQRKSIFMGAGGS